MASGSKAAFNSPGDAANGDRRPASILLNNNAYVAFYIDHPPDIADDSNETTATAKSKSGHTMAVTLWVADPPDISFFSVVCSKPPNSNPKSADFKSSPHVVGAEGRFVLFCANFASRSPATTTKMNFSCTRLATPSPHLWNGFRFLMCDDDFTTTADRLHGVREFGIVPQGVHYLVAALCDADDDASLDYQLHIYSSESKTWSSKTLPNTRAKKMKPGKVITLGEGVLGWVDLSRGLLVCDLCQEPPSAYFIPLPRPSLANRGRLRLPEASPRLFRDLTCVDGKLKFIDMEHGDTPEKFIDPFDSSVQYDSDLIRSLDSDDESKSRRGWRAVTWIRTVSSKGWFKECTLGVADILVDEFRDLYSVFPTLSIDNGDILYLKSSVEPTDGKGWAVAVDLGKKTVKALGAFPFENRHPAIAKQGFRPSTLSCHLAITPGIRVSAYGKIAQAGGSANSPQNAALQSLMREELEKLKRIQDESQSSMQNDQSRMKQQRLLDEKITLPLNKASSIVQNDLVSLDRPVQSNREKLEKLKRIWHESQSSMQNDQPSMKQQRLLAEKITQPLDRAPSIVQNNHISHVHPVQNNLPPQQCFNKWDQPYLPGHSYFTQQNDLVSFNMLNGFCGYAPMAPTPVHGYGNYQPLWHQPPPWKQPPWKQQQQQPSSEFEPHKASCFNKHNGASYHGYVQQLPANTHLVFGNDQ
ncbi:unnamed protein product [Urochloa decumbens]|uniref:DUF1618 domain-containing protein n=1 Tax=Urochloa decumbens TaxID=240449 RepID=A0ABC8XNY6_9POAL